MSGNNQSPKSILSSLFEFFFFFFIFSLFLTLGSDTEKQLQVRLIFGIVLFASSFFIRRNQEFQWNLTLIACAGFFGFEVIRSIWMLVSNHFADPKIHQPNILENYIHAPVIWGVCFGILLLCSDFFKKRRTVFYLLNGMAWMGMFLAINAIPPLLSQGSTGYLDEGGREGFFFPLVYFHEWVSQYWVGKFAHPNWTGDVIAFGFFPALGLTLYSTLNLIENKEKNLESDGSPVWLRPVQWGFITLVTISAIFLMFSRGTILCLGISLAFYFGWVLLKMRSLKVLGIAVAFVIVIVGFSFFAGNLDEAFKEIQTISEEKDALERGPSREQGVSDSVYSVEEGIRRAQRIFKEYPVWGIGTQSYLLVARNYVTSEKWKRYRLADYQAMSHYFHLLAEEGMGALIYFLFLVLYFVEVNRRLWQVRSRFQFIMALSLLAPVILVLGHAAFNHLMQRVAISLLVYISMGASLAILRKDFSHEKDH